ncbi:uncharacterized protein PITG_08868 [Phytophthora infestans T30-4]|uniref:Uncharacterized protein n=1 Tax=Phytophthora infestans (strain T30-4) TaxID=403677 RepID=D0NDD4_PHYIT|nr:uncharacterized protein PITG_08868 [Phytophthora infestans T30-4]EEY56091.1 conserved hypothetical protein [Phytophthora infestans T30-4]|eukprot:XP_002902921.1 conserved hypothetical protein [Phytophthora infestans T30-4]
MPTPVRTPLRTYPKKTIRPDMSIYIKPSQTARQRDWKRTKDSGPFEIEVFVLAANKERHTLPGTRRVTASRIQEATASIDEYLAQRPELQGSTITLPDTATFAQAQHLDAMLAEEESEYDTVNVRVNGSREIPITFSIQEFRRVMQLPSYNLLASGVFPSFVPPQEPDEDVEDLDHVSD